MTDPAYGPSFFNGLDEDERDEFGDLLECLDDHDDRKGECSGPIRYYPSRAGTGTMIPRCERHQEMHDEAADRYDEVMPDSDIPPAWFDPSAIGESWNPDD